MKRIPETCMRMEILRGWEIMDEIGAGGYGVVFRVRSNKTNEEAALKWIHIERDDARGFDGELFLDAQTNLLNEISVMKKLSDTPEIVSIYDAAYQIAPSGNEMDVIILMELLSPLTGILKNGEITVMQVGQMTDDVARALSVCHERDIIHGDVKPENILCGKNNYKLSDFGVSLSKLMPGRTEARGTQYFRPPEYERSQNASKQGDVYSLGMMLYVLFNNGRLPFQNGFSAEDESRAWQEYRNLSLLPNGALPRPQFAASAIADVILRAISPDMQARYRTVSEFVSDFDAAFAHLSAAEKALPLPYCKSDEFLSEEVKMYLSTGRKTPTFDMNSAPEPEKKPEPVSQSPRQAGFVIPTAAIQEKKVDSETKNTKEEKKKPAKARFLLIPLIIVLAAACVFAYIRFAPAAFEYEKVISETSAVFTLLSGGEADFSASCLPEGAQ
ncbi:MAG: serine/threonine protein kinase, partial [Clostridia bacterium]|nr:serine/threonine protein kinase [Clostridia bacterium]